MGLKKGEEYIASLKSLGLVSPMAQWIMIGRQGEIASKIDRVKQLLDIA